jgi:acyl-CoA synthetase (AMP-forming)/AMP-acid ligase II
MSASDDMKMMRLLARLREHATIAPQQIAFRDVATGQTLTYSRLFRLVAGVAQRLRSSLAPESVVMICCPNSCDFPIAFLATLAADCAAFPISTESPAIELQNTASRAGATAIIGTESALAATGSMVQTAIQLADLQSIKAEQLPASWATGDQTRLMLMSSGSTGMPKIVCRSANAVDAVSRQMSNAIGFDANDHVLATVPLCHSYGIEHGLLAPLWAGASVHLCRGLDLSLVPRELRQGGITVLPGVPSMFEMLANVGDDRGPLTDIKAAYSAGGPLPATVATSFQEEYDVVVSQLYGATEIGSVTYSNPRWPHFDSTSVGCAMEGVTIKIADDGQVWINAASMFSGYLHDVTNLVVDGFWPTGDLGRLDAHGNLTIIGRIKLLIDIGGLKVNPFEVEQVLMKHPDVGDCVVIPVRQSETVRRIKAIVTPRNPGTIPDIEALRQFARHRLTSYKVPRLFEVRESLPKSATGKLLRHQVTA